MTAAETPGTIPEKKYFRIGEVSGIVGVDPHVLRFWETEFRMIRPRRARSKQRLYRRKDVENLLRIKVLLHDEGYTISGARRVLKNDSTRVPLSVSGEAVLKDDRLRLIKEELQAILARLDGDGKKG